MVARDLSDSTLATGCRDSRNNSANGQSMACVSSLGTGAQVVTGGAGIQLPPEKKKTTPLIDVTAKSEFIKLISFHFEIKS